MAKEYIHLNAVYTQAWEYMLYYSGEYGKNHTPSILPPPLRIVNKKDELIKYNDSQFREMCCFNDIWYKIDRICTINPVDYAVVINVDSYYSVIKSNFDNKISYEMLYFLILHDIIHELCHYIHSYYLWLSIHNDKCDDNSIEVAYKYVLDKINNFGSQKDESENEKRTLRYWSEIFGFYGLIPKATGAYAKFLKKNKSLKTKYYAAVIYDYVYTSEQFRNYYDTYDKDGIAALEDHWDNIISEIKSEAGTKINICITE